MVTKAHMHAELITVRVTNDERAARSHAARSSTQSSV
jgi:hypothetical protein